MDNRTGSTRILNRSDLALYEYEPNAVICNGYFIKVNRETLTCHSTGSTRQEHL
jgi:hypothetical protein